MPSDLNTLLSKFLGSLTAGRPTYPAGGGTAQPVVSGTLTTNTTTAGTIADTNETDLWTYSLPANTLNVDGRTLRITTWFTVANNANNKRVRLYVGGTAIGDSGAFAFGSALNQVKLQGIVWRTGAAAELTMTELVFNGGSPSTYTAVLASDTTAAITIKVTGLNGTASANDIIFKSAVVELLN
jgi:hypothetical protein